MNTDGIELRSRCASLVLVLGIAAAAVPATAAAGSGSHHQRTESPRVRFRDGHGIHVVSARRATARVWRLVVRTRELQRAVDVDVVLPRGYATSSRRYPVLYLLHGTSGGAHDWIASGRLTSATADLPLTTVLPDGGYDHDGGSFWTNGVAQHTSLGRADWEAGAAPAVVRIRAGDAAARARTP